MDYSSNCIDLSSLVENIKCKNSTGVQKIGLEMEMHLYDAKNFIPIGLENAALSPQVLMKDIARLSKNAVLKRDGAYITGVSLVNGANFSIEPGGQIEYSSTPCSTLNELALEVTAALELLTEAGKGQVIFLSHGTNPIARDDHPLLLEKRRYQIMTRYFKSAPAEIRGLDMMRHCATVQANLDIFGEENWRDAVNLSVVLVPLTQNLFANSAYFKGKKSNYYSERQQIWQQMDPSRSGLAFAKLHNFSIDPASIYAQWAQQANVFLIDDLELNEQPLYNELSFAQWQLKPYKAVVPKPTHWQNHLSTLFPHIRLRNFLELRHIDAQPFAHSFAPIAFFSTLLQDSANRAKVWDLLQDYGILHKDFENNQNLQADIAEELLNLACIMAAKESSAYNTINNYKNFFQDKKTYWQANSALDFVQQHSTSNPAAEFSLYTREF